MKKIIFFILILLAGCASNPQIPKWVINTPQDNNNYLYATGSDYTKNLAIQKALNNAASKLNVNISSEFIINRGVFKNKAYNDVAQQINAKVTNIQINNYQIIKSQKIDNKIYVLIKINKNKLKQNLITQINLSLDKINNLLSNSYGFQKVKNSYQALKIISNTQQKILILQSLNQNISNYINLLQKYNKQAKYNIQHTFFSINTNYFKKQITDVLSNYLAISNNASNKIQIQISLKKAYILNQYIIVGKCFINFGNQTKTIKFKGQSYTDYKTARIKASSNLKKALKQIMKDIL